MHVDTISQETFWWKDLLAGLKTCSYLKDKLNIVLDSELWLNWESCNWKDIEKCVKAGSVVVWKLNAGGLFL